MKKKGKLRKFIASLKARKSRSQIQEELKRSAGGEECEEHVIEKACIKIGILSAYSYLETA